MDFKVRDTIQTMYLALIGINIIHVGCFKG